MGIKKECVFGEKEREWGGGGDYIHCNRYMYIYICTCMLHTLICNSELNVPMQFNFTKYFLNSSQQSEC